MPCGDVVFDGRENKLNHNADNKLLILNSELAVAAQPLGHVMNTLCSKAVSFTI